MGCSCWPCGVLSVSVLICVAECIIGMLWMSVPAFHPPCWWDLRAGSCSHRKVSKATGNKGCCVRWHFIRPRNERKTRANFLIPAVSTGSEKSYSSFYTTCCTHNLGAQHHYRHICSTSTYGLRALRLPAEGICWAISELRVAQVAAHTQMAPRTMLFTHSCHKEIAAGAWH